MISPPSDGARRIACVEPCQIDAGVRARGIVWNLSPGGAYVVVDHTPGLGEKLSLVFSLPGDEKPIKAEARVAWRNPPSQLKGCGSRSFGLPPGCGLEFLVIVGDDLRRIEAHVKRTEVFRSRTAMPSRRQATPQV